MHRGKYLLAILLSFILIPLPASLSDASSYGSRSASVKQQLYLTILPAMETKLEANETIQRDGYLYKSYTVYVRSNAPWNMSAEAIADPGRVHRAQCLYPDQTLPDNSDDNFQTYPIYCYQQLSWADDSERDIAIEFTTFQSSGL